MRVKEEKERNGERAREGEEGERRRREGRGEENIRMGERRGEIQNLEGAPEDGFIDPREHLIYNLVLLVLVEH